MGVIHSLQTNLLSNRFIYCGKHWSDLLTVLHWITCVFFILWNSKCIFFVHKPRSSSYPTSSATTVMWVFLCWSHYDEDRISKLLRNKRAFPLLNWSFWNSHSSNWCSARSLGISLTWRSSDVKWRLELVFWVISISGHWWWFPNQCQLTHFDRCFQVSTIRSWRLLCNRLWMLRIGKKKNHLCKILKTPIQSFIEKLKSSFFLSA